MEPAGALARALASCVLADRSAWTRLRATGRDILDLLHRLSTQDLKGLPVGGGAPTVLTSAKGRIVERLFVHRLAEREVLILAGPGRADAVLAHLGKYTFAEDTGLTDVTGATAQFALHGPQAASGLVAAGLADPGAYAAVRACCGGAEVVVLGEDGFSSAGRTVIAPRAQSAAVRAVLERGAPAADAGTLEAWRVLSGLPGPGTELTEDHNPLEAGLRDHVSFTKGCYVGQEVVARLNTYDKVARRLVVLRFAAGIAPPPPGTEIFAGDRPCGRVTTAVRLPDGAAAALAFVKTAERATTLRAGGAEGSIVTP